LDTREEWNRIFSRIDEVSAGEDAWLERWQRVLDASQGSTVLDLGCGDGHDARFLTERGFPVIATDFSEKALELTRHKAPAAKAQNVDLTRGLPFPDASFGVIVASLSLHYFPWQQTTEILAEVHRCLPPGGHLLARFNSTRDHRYRIAEKQPLENNFYLIGGMPRRLFDKQDLDTLFEKGWEILTAEERTTHRYGGKKLAWEVAAKRAVSSEPSAFSKCKKADR
jgi:ubiquinone/menaquinone biosynthesis C-methylase UbiE